jgi:Holliday junction resolvasome RuvABC ATP-dependent DNA helicase subunit
MQPTAESLQRAAERCLRERRRFPHTLIIGPRDSSKRTLARAIAWEMAVPVVEVDVKSMRDLHTVDAKVADAGFTPRRVSSTPCSTARGRGTWA